MQRTNQSTIMKLIVILFIGSAAIVTAKIPDYVPEVYHDLIETLRQTCMGPNGLTEDMVDNYEISNDSANFKCYMKCMMLEAKWMKPTGEIDYDKIMAQIHPDIEHIAMPLLEKCRVIGNGPHECDHAYMFNQCLAAADPKHYFLP